MLYAGNSHSVVFVYVWRRMALIALDEICSFLKTGEMRSEGKSNRVEILLCEAVFCQMNLDKDASLWNRNMPS